jgi:UTP-glucose-1-phosphate uridylyltransferase
MSRSNSGLVELYGERGGFWATLWSKSKRFIRNLFRKGKARGEIDTGGLEFVILAAGKSTRSYPHAKGLPHKSLVPFGSRKVIDHIMGQVIKAGGRHITIVVADDLAADAFKRCFTREPEIESKFAKKGNLVGLGLLQSLYVPENIDIKYVVQKEPRGTGHAAGLAYEGIKDTGRAMVMIWPDDIILADKCARYADDREPIYKRAVEKYITEGGRGNIVITRYVKDPSRWGIIEDGYYVEKPEQSRSHDAAQGFCIFDPAVCKEILKDTHRLDKGEDLPGLAGGEMTFIPALNRVIDRDPAAMKIRTVPMAPTDIYFDCGSIEGYEKALLYTLLTESEFNGDNLKFIEAVLPRVQRNVQRKNKEKSKHDQH